MRNKITSIIIMVSLILLNSCKKEEAAIFDKNASARMTEAIEKVHKTIQANSNGWLIKYYPNKSRSYGGFTLFARFISDSEVELTSDVDDEVIKSTYSVIPESGPILSFNTYNEIIHFFSEPGNDSGVGPADSGIGGDFEFIVLETTDNKISLKGKKTGNLMVMTALVAGEFEALPTKYQDEDELFSEFGTFKIEMPDKTLKGLSASYRTFTIDDPANPEFFSFRVIPGGLEFYEEMEVGGVKFSTMTYHAAESAYPMGYYSDPSNAVKIIPQPMPLNVWFRQNLWGFAYSKVGATGVPYWNTTRTALTTKGWVLNSFGIGEYYGYKAMAFVLNNGAAQGGVTYDINLIAGTEDQVRLVFGGSVLNLSGFTASFWNEAVVSLHTPISNRTFKITGVSGPDKPNEILLTDIANPLNTFQVVLGTVNDPMNK